MKRMKRAGSRCVQFSHFVTLNFVLSLRCGPFSFNFNSVHCGVSAIHWMNWIGMVCLRVSLSLFTFFTPNVALRYTSSRFASKFVWRNINSITVFPKLLVIGFKLVAGAIASNAFTGVAIGVGFIFASLVYSISRNPSQRDELLRFSFIGFSLVEASGLIGLVMSFVLLFGL